MSTPPSSDDPRPGADRPSPDDEPTARHQAPPQWAPPPQPQSWGQRPPQAQPAYGQPAYGQPAYGQQPAGWQPPGPGRGQQPPPWAPPPAAPRDRTRTLLIAALVAIALAIAGATALLVYVLSSTILDRTAVEAAVAEQFEQREGVPIDLECDERMIVRVGGDYECEGTTADGEDVEIIIEVRDENGAYTWAED